ncbi:unnamed protein product [Meganyctiphanes norvegica]|uniref:G-protein coupled receptors family 1 profile domain-containing protein n=1 Tax=Meganyctiphanes norvegica TaxID=48144 RepID=A0AAV2QQZ2_MEGNR
MDFLEPSLDYMLGYNSSMEYEDPDGYWGPVYVPVSPSPLNVTTSVYPVTENVITKDNNTLEGLFNFSDCSGNMTSDATNPYVLTMWHQLIWSALFGGMVVVATGGNLIVIWIVVADHRMRTVTNIFLVNLSIADAMVSTLNMIFNCTFMLTGHWPFGNIYCKISQFVSVLSICASVFTLMAISFDRYIAIMHPLRPRMGRRATLMIVVWIWVSAVSLAMPNALFYKTAAVIQECETRTICYGEWPDGEQGHSNSEYIHTLVLMVLTYILPVLCMGFTYSRIGFTLWGSRSIGEQTQRQMDAIRSKRKVVKMMVVVVIIFTVCWLPYHTIFILFNVIPEISHYAHIQEIFLGIYWLAMSNSMYNPMIYCWLNNRFRNGFKRVFSACPCIHYVPEVREVSHVKTTRFSCSGSPETNHRISSDGSKPFAMRTFVTEVNGTRRTTNGADNRTISNIKADKYNQYV